MRDVRNMKREHVTEGERSMGYPAIQAEIRLAPTDQQNTDKNPIV